MSPFTYFTFDNQLYPSRNIELADGISVIVATTRLSDALLTADGDYVSEQAGLLDDLICFYVEDDLIGWDEPRLVALVEAAVLGGG